MIRTFKPKPVEKEKIWRIIENANRSPSAGHLEPQEFIVVTHPTVKRRLAEAALNQMFIAEARWSLWSALILGEMFGVTGREVESSTAQ